MSHLSELNVKSVTRKSTQDPVQRRRDKLVAAIDEQLKAAAAAFKGERYEVQRKAWTKNEHGEKVLVERTRQVRPWFFEQDGGWYVQCRYGNKVLNLGKGNAVFVKNLSDMQGVLATLRAACEVGELDSQIASLLRKRMKK